MQIKIVDRPWFTWQTSKQYMERIKALAGQWLEVETEYLFKSGFNTPSENPELYENGLRVSTKDVAEIKDDMRRYRKFCHYCHHHSALVEKVCKHCGHTDHFERFFPKKKKIKHSLGTIEFKDNTGDTGDEIHSNERKSKVRK